MSTDMNRFILSLTPELEAEANELKKSEFFNKSKAEMYRYLISLGLESVKDKKVNIEDVDEAKK